MDRHDAEEAAHLLDRVLASLLSWGPVRGHQGADLRSAIGRLRLHAEEWLYTDSVADHLIDCFDLARIAGVNRAQFAAVRRVAEGETAVSLGAWIVRQAAIYLCLATEADLVRKIRFASRNDVEVVRSELNDAFNQLEEEAADAMDSMSYRALIQLHAAVTNYLVSIARPLPSMLRYQFNFSMPTLVMAQRLYGDASRYDEIRLENRIKHPLFCPLAGSALSG